jgi:hypothetical protein
MSIRHRQSTKQYISAEITARDMISHRGTILRQMQDVRATTVIQEVTKLFYCLHPDKRMCKIQVENDPFAPTYKVLSVKDENGIHHEVWCSVGFDGITSFSERVVRHHS